jgi:hypothetical protein
VPGAQSERRGDEIRFSLFTDRNSNSNEPPGSPRRWLDDN